MINIHFQNIYIWLSQWVMTLISEFLNTFFGRLSKMALKIHNGNYAVFPLLSFKKMSIFLKQYCFHWISKFLFCHLPVPTINCFFTFKSAKNLWKNFCLWINVTIIYFLISLGLASFLVIPFHICWNSSSFFLKFLFPEYFPKSRSWKEPT